jgi:hypothetical protein
VCLDARGRLIDEAVARSAREILGRAAGPAPTGGATAPTSAGHGA